MNKGMNSTEKRAYSWLVGQGFTTLDFQRRGNPDFISPDGTVCFEVKLARRNVLVFSEGQIADLEMLPQTTVIVMRPGETQPTAQIPIGEFVGAYLKSRSSSRSPIHVRGFRVKIVDTDRMSLFKVKYICLHCGESFVVSQGSQRKYCDLCYTSRVTAGRPPKALREEGK